MKSYQRQSGSQTHHQGHTGHCTCCMPSHGRQEDLARSGSAQRGCSGALQGRGAPRANSVSSQVKQLQHIIDLQSLSQGLQEAAQTISGRRKGSA